MEEYKSDPEASIPVGKHRIPVMAPGGEDHQEAEMDGPDPLVAIAGDLASDEEDSDADLAIPDIDLETAEERKAERASNRVGTSLEDALPVEGGFEMQVDENHKEFIPIKQAQSIVMSCLLKSMQEDPETFCSGHATFKERQEARNAWSLRNLTKEEQGYAKDLGDLRREARKAQQSAETLDQVTYEAKQAYTEAPRERARKERVLEAAKESLFSAKKTLEKAKTMDLSSLKQEVKRVRRVMKRAKEAQKKADSRLDAAEEALRNAKEAMRCYTRVRDDAKKAVRGKKADFEKRQALVAAEKSVKEGRAAMKSCQALASRLRGDQKATKSRVENIQKGLQRAIRARTQGTVSEMETVVRSRQAALTVAERDLKKVAYRGALKNAWKEALEKSTTAKNVFEDFKTRLEDLQPKFDAVKAKVDAAVPPRHGFIFIKCNGLVEDIKAGKLDFSIHPEEDIEAVPDERAKRLVALTKNLKDVPVVVNLTIHPSHLERDTQGFFKNPAGVGLFILHTKEWCAKGDCNQPPDPDQTFRAKTLTAEYFYCSKECMKADASCRKKFLPLARQISKEWKEAGETDKKARDDVLDGVEGSGGEDAGGGRPCSSCRKDLPRSAYNKKAWETEDEDFLVEQIDDEGEPVKVLKTLVRRVCRVCALPPPPTKPCFLCKKDLPRAAYSAKHWRGHRSRHKCAACLACYGAVVTNGSHLPTTRAI